MYPERHSSLWDESESIYTEVDSGLTDLHRGGSLSIQRCNSTGVGVQRVSCAGIYGLSSCRADNAIA